MPDIFFANGVSIARTHAFAGANHDPIGFYPRGPVNSSSEQYIFVTNGIGQLEIGKSYRVVDSGVVFWNTMGASSNSLGTEFVYNGGSGAYGGVPGYASRIRIRGAYNTSAGTSYSIGNTYFRSNARVTTTFADVGGVTGATPTNIVINGNRLYAVNPETIIRPFLRYHLWNGGTVTGSTLNSSLSHSPYGTGNKECFVVLQGAGGGGGGGGITVGAKGGASGATIMAYITNVGNITSVGTGAMGAGGALNNGAGGTGGASSIFAPSPSSTFSAGGGTGGSGQTGGSVAGSVSGSFIFATSLNTSSGSTGGNGSTTATTNVGNAGASSSAFTVTTSAFFGAYVAISSITSTASARFYANFGNLSTNASQSNLSSTSGGSNTAHGGGVGNPPGVQGYYPGGGGGGSKYNNGGASRPKTPTNEAVHNGWLGSGGGGGRGRGTFDSDWACGGRGGQGFAYFFA